MKNEMNEWVLTKWNITEVLRFQKANVFNFKHATTSDSETLCNIQYIYSALLLSDESVHLNHINTTEFNDSLILTNSPSHIGRF